MLYHYNKEPDKLGNETFTYSEKNTETDEVVYEVFMVPIGNKKSIEILLICTTRYLKD